MANAQYTQTYNSFSGVDMEVAMGGTVIGELQGISFTITREKAPLYTMGSADPRSFSRGKRGIAGSFVFLVFDRSALLDTLGLRARYMANSYEVNSYQRSRGTVENVNQQLGVTPKNFNVGTSGQGIVTVDGFRSGDPGRTFTTDKVVAPPLYHDQIPPFEIVITAANEYGHHANMSIHGVEIMNCGSGLSIDDITTDEACTFIATSLTPWDNQGFVDPRNPGVRVTSDSVGRPGAGYAS